jgi:hypothetical protein
LTSEDFADLNLGEYAYFERLFWGDSAGHQVLKWETTNQSTLDTDLSTRPYFQAVKKGDLWYFATSGPSGPQFRVDPLFSVNTAKYTAIISRPVTPPVTACWGKDRTNLVITSMVSPLSLTDPVLPPDYGFALIDRNGKVLFHSSSSKSGQENLFDQLDDDRQFRAAVASRQPAYLNAGYIGFDSAGTWSLEIVSAQGLTIRSRQTLSVEEMVRIVREAQCCACRRRQLSQAVAAEWEWRNGSGQLKDMAARSLLVKLHERGYIELPPRRQRPTNRMMRRPSVAAADWDTTPVVGTLSSVGRLTIREVSTDRTASQECAAALAQFHYLGWGGTVGENLVYAVITETGRLIACMIFGAPAWKCAARDGFIGWTAEQRQRHLTQVIIHTLKTDRVRLTNSVRGGLYAVVSTSAPVDTFVIRRAVGDIGDPDRSRSTTRSIGTATSGSARMAGLEGVLSTAGVLWTAID